VIEKKVHFTEASQDTRSSLRRYLSVLNIIQFLYRDLTTPLLVSACGWHNKSAGSSRLSLLGEF